MKEPRWIDFPRAYERFHDKAFKAEVAIPGQGLFDGRNGTIWVRQSPEPDKVAITIVFENHTPTAGQQFRFYLTQDQSQRIIPCDDSDADFTFDGRLEPENLTKPDANN
jgi:hypothetical protein